MRRYWYFILSAIYLATLFSLFFKGVFLSPDENAAYQFTQYALHEGSMRMPQNYDEAVKTLLHPRSVVSLGDYLVPGSFLGLPITYAILSLPFLFLPYGALMLTPCLVLVALWCWWKIVETCTHSERIAFWATIFLAFHPAFWYWSMRGMMHNVPFVCFLIFSGFFITRPNSRFWHGVGAGVCLGTALWMRSVEAIWVVPLTLVITAVLWKQRSVVFFAAAFGGAMLIAGCGLYANYVTYGSWLTTGYTVERQQVEVDVSSAPALSSVPLTPAQNIADTVLRLQPRALVKNILAYQLALFPIASTLVLCGYVVVIRRQWHVSRAWRVWICMFPVLVLGLLLMYGNWTTFDNPDPRSITIGNSHVRYWLPIVMFGSLGAGMVLSAQEERSRLRAWLLFVFFVAQSITVVFFTPDGVLPSRRALATFTQKREVILDNTPLEAIIITDRADKYIWPHRSVRVPLRDTTTYAALPMLLSAGPVYYFGITLPQKDIDWLNTVTLAPNNVHIHYILTVQDESLYVFSRE